MLDHLDSGSAVSMVIQGCRKNFPKNKRLTNLSMGVGYFFELIFKHPSPNQLLQFLDISAFGHAILGNEFRLLIITQSVFFSV